MCDHLHLPLQSGSDRVLAAMHRGYTAERYLETLAAARAAIADLAVTTDIIVGFPGETDDDFAPHPRGRRRGRVRLRLHLHLLAPARHRGRRARRRCSCAADVVAERFERLRRVVERSALAQARGPHRPDRGGRWSRARAARTRRVLTGRTGQNKLVHFAVAGAAADRLLRHRRGHRRRPPPPAGRTARRRPRRHPQTRIPVAVG